MKKLILVLALFLAFDGKSQNIGKDAALADFDAFVALLNSQSSYFQLSDYDFDGHCEEVRKKISTRDSVSIPFLAFEIEKVIAETIDRHASVKMEDFDEDGIDILDLHFPFILAPFQNKLVALAKVESPKGYKYYAEEYPFVESINDIPALQFIEKYAYKRKNSPQAAKLYDATKDLRDIGESFFNQGEFDQRELTIVLTNGTSSKRITLPLSEDKHRWNNVGHTQDVELIKATYIDEPFEYQKLHRWIADSISYLQLPAMFAYEDFAGLESYLNMVMKNSINAKALIIDVRGNGGGSRDILHTLSGYIVQPAQSPWVANLAYVRTDQRTDEDIKGMDGRFLFRYSSDQFTNDDRKAIDAFNSHFTTPYTFDQRKFSEPFYMLLKSNGTPLNCPVYILADERSFSAASVFASALKGLANVKIAGVTTNGSSGRSRRFTLTHSNIRIRLSTMLSFQRNGKVLDGNGTEPDIVIDRKEAQLLGKSDTQLDDLISLIKKN